MGTKKFLWGSALALAATLAVAAPAAAQSVDYPPDADSRTFADSIGGWTADTDHEGLGPVGELLCVLNPLTCPSVSNSWAPSGGTQGAQDGYLRSDVGGVLGVVTATTITWQSPEFTYGGVGGQVPDDVFFTFDRRTDAGALIELLQDGWVDVSLENTTDGDSLKIVSRLPIEEVNNWTSIPAVQVQNDQLDVGDTYRVRIDTVLDIPLVSVIPDASFHYDNVLLRASKEDPQAPDIDGDGIPVPPDNCPVHPNPPEDVDNNPATPPVQRDTDGDGAGDICDLTPTGPNNDTDGDGVPTPPDNCPVNPNPSQADSDGDGAGDVCDPTPTGPDRDLDGDGIPAPPDNCPFVPNANQLDTDDDDVGNACDPTPNGPGSGNEDPDGDGVPSDRDNCPLVSNPSQTDTDGDNIGDACDATPNGPPSGGGGGGGGAGGPLGGDSAVFDGRNLFIKLRCFGVAEKGKCFSRATVFASRGGTRYTFPIQRVVPAKGGKVVRARIRFQYRTELEQADSVSLKSVLRTSRQAKEKTTKFKTLQLIKR